MIRIDKKAYWKSDGPHNGWLWFKPRPRTWEFIVWWRRDQYACISFEEERHAEIERKQNRWPCYLGFHRTTGKYYWQYRDEIFSCDEEFNKDIIIGFYEKRTASKAARIQKYETVGKAVRRGKRGKSDSEDNKIAESAVSALINLGYKKSESMKAIAEALKDHPKASIELLIRLGLAGLAPKRAK